MIDRGLSLENLISDLLQYFAQFILLTPVGNSAFIDYNQVLFDLC